MQPHHPNHPPVQAISDQTSGVVSILDATGLTQLTQRISMERFHRPFVHQIAFNARLRACGGRYFPKTGHIEISWHHYLNFGLEEVEGIIKHELCHYHLHQQGLPSGHRDQTFKALLAAVGAPRYCRVLPPNQSNSGKNSKNRKSRAKENVSQGKREPYRYRVVCNGCARYALRKRKMRIDRFRCGKCRGTLRLEAFQ